ncbi:HAD family acid phosphatase [Allosphingosinicella flava]|uniref:HAD family acid phosphatase n=1 Tax=Allosphingosinicella flava TaxID=2771430 RepID=UPI001CF7BB71|nr:HAD family acid phosphatase [Sphingosinicella flava]
MPAPAAKPAEPPATMQWLYGSGEAGALGIQAYHAMRDFVLVQALAKRSGQSVVLAEGSTLQAPQFRTCRPDEPLAVILDVDETALLNLGYEYDEAKGRAYDAGIWDRWEKTGAGAVAPVPGAVTALRAIRQAGVTVVFNSNRQAANAAATAAAIEGAGLGPAKHGETLFLKGDVAPGSEKDPRRALVANRYCVVAMAGDQLGDFSDLFNARDLAIPARRAAATGGTFARLWGNGWFLLPNPVYGPGVRGSFDDVFPADKRWSDPAGEK